MVGFDDATNVGAREELDVLCRSLFLTRSRASSNAAAAVAGRFADVAAVEVDGASDTCELLVMASSAFWYRRLVVATASGIVRVAYVIRHGSA